jgi:DeoR family fructose operon transcriptional repressor
VIAEERRNALVEYLSQKEYTPLSKIFSAFPDISPSTIRRDLQALTAQGRVVLMRGGAKLPDAVDMADLPIDTKLHIHTHEKQRMAFLASKLIKDNDIVYLDSSSSVYPVLTFVKDKRITVVTSGLNTAWKAMKLGLRCVLVGGDLRADVGSVVGPLCCEQLKTMHFDVALMGCNGFSEEHGISTPHAEEAAKIRIVKENSTCCRFLLDHSKCGRSFTYRALPLNEAEVISDKPCAFSDRFASFTVAKRTNEPMPTVYDTDGSEE